MESQNPVVETTPAVNAESAPVQEVNAVEPAESAPAQDALQNTEVEGAEPSKAIKELISQRKKRQAAEQEAAYWRGIAEGKGYKPESNIPEPVAVPTPQVAAPPTSDQYESWDDYERARDSYILEQTEQRLVEKFRQQQAQQESVQKQTLFQQKIEAAALQDPTILSIVEDRTLPLHTHALPLLFESEVAPELLKKLNGDRGEATRLFQLFQVNPVKAAKEFGILEYQLKNAPKPEPPKRVSAAPEPIPTVTPAGNAVVDEENLPMDQWVARRNASAKRR